MEETKWLQAFADRVGHPHGIVAEVLLAQPDAAAVTERSFFGANWPGDRIFSSYPDVLNAYAGIVGRFTPDEQEAMFSHNAERIFGI